MVSNSFVGTAITAAFVLGGCNSPSRAIRPVIYAHPEDRYQAMKSAPVIVVAEILTYKLVTGARNVERPGAPATPLYLARISANILLSVRGNQRGRFDFYSWVWASGKHGGAGLFRPFPGCCHILFLQEQAGYLHTAGDYPAYDLEFSTHWLPAVASALRAGAENAPDLFERIVAVFLRMQLEERTAITRNFQPAKIWDLAGLTSPFYVASRLDSFCLHMSNPYGRFAACEAVGREFPGRCAAYRLARKADAADVEAAFVTQELTRCEAGEEGTIAFLRANNWPLGAFDYGWRQTAERHRLSMRTFAAAMDAKMRAAACLAASAMPEARDIPECGVSGQNL